MFIKSNTDCNGTLYMRGQKIDKEDKNYKQLLKDKLLANAHPDVKVVVEPNTELEEKVTALEKQVETLTSQRDEVVDALEKEIKKVTALEKQVESLKAKSK